MSLDRHAAERRRFARVLGTDGELGSGLPIGTHSSQGQSTDDEREDERDAEREPEAATKPRDR